jgi:hypothetical protein
MISLRTCSLGEGNTKQEDMRRKHQARRYWKGANGGERNKFGNMDQRCKTRKMFPFNLKEN